jgi:hypothetical protein
MTFYHCVFLRKDRLILASSLREEFNRAFVSILLPHVRRVDNRRAPAYDSREENPVPEIP